MWLFFVYCWFIFRFLSFFHHRSHFNFFYCFCCSTVIPLLILDAVIFFYNRFDGMFYSMSFFFFSLFIHGPVLMKLPCTRLLLLLLVPLLLLPFAETCFCLCDVHWFSCQAIVCRREIASNIQWLVKLRSFQKEIFVYKLIFSPRVRVFFCVSILLLMVYCYARKCLSGLFDCRCAVKAIDVAFQSSYHSQTYRNTPNLTLLNSYLRFTQL